jgi:transcriptional regulator with GAF, ATPase, and Fis domain
VDVRIIAATNRYLKKEVQGGKFRQDLYYRLNVFPIEVAPLRQRKDDIQPLAAHFLRVASGRMNRPVPSLESSQVTALEAYSWPGNVRELQNVIERAVITSRPGRLRFDLPREEPAPYPGNWSSHDPKEAREVLSDRDIKQRERENIIAALDQCRWKIYGPGGAAELLGIKPTTLTSRIKKMGLQRPARQAQQGYA